MGYNEAKYMDIKGIFSGGYVDNTPDFLLEDRFSPFLRNCRAFGHSVETRPGHTLLAEFTNGGVGYGIGYDSRNDQIVVRYDYSATQKIVLVDPDTGVVTPVTTGTNITSSDKMRFYSIGDSVYCLNGVDGIGQLTGTTYINTQPYAAYKTTVFGSSSGGDLIGTFEDYIDGYTYGTVPHGLVNNQVIVFTPGNGTWVMPTGTSFGTRYYVIVVSPTIFELSATSGGAAIAYTDSGTQQIVSNLLINPKYGAVFNGSFFVSGDSYRPNSVFYSSSLSPTQFSVGGAGTLDQFPEQIVGLNSTNETIFYFSKSTVYATSTSDVQDVNGIYSYVTRPLQITEGAQGHDSIVTIGNYVFYLTPSNTINYLERSQVGGFNNIELAGRTAKGVSTLMESLADAQTEAFGAYYPKQLMARWCFRTEGSEVNDVSLIYDVKNDLFLVDTNKFFTGVAVANGKAYALSQVEPKVYIDEDGYTDEDTPIEFQYWTKQLDVGDVTRYKQFWEARIAGSINAQANTILEVYVNEKLVDATTITFDDSNSGTGGGIAVVPVWSGIASSAEGLQLRSFIKLRTKGNLQKKGTTIQLRFRDSSLASKIRLSSLQVKAELMPAITNNKR